MKIFALLDGSNLDPVLVGEGPTKHQKENLKDLSQNSRGVFYYLEE